MKDRDGYIRGMSGSEGKGREVREEKEGARRHVGRMKTIKNIIVGPMVSTIKNKIIGQMVSSIEGFHCK